MWPIEIVQGDGGGFTQLVVEGRKDMVTTAGDGRQQLPRTKGQRSWN